MSKIINYLKQTKLELKHVIWPKNRQTIIYTITVIILSFLVAYFLSSFDYIFSRGLEKLLSF